MASVNKVFVLGTLGRDPEVRSGKTAIANLSLATSRKYKAADGTLTEETEWHRVSIFGKTAEIAEQYLHKGDQTLVEGRLRTRKYTDKDGIERYTAEIVCEHLTLLSNGRRANNNDNGGGNGGGSGRATYDTLADEDVPF